MCVAKVLEPDAGNGLGLKKTAQDRRALKACRAKARTPGFRLIPGDVLQRVAANDGEQRQNADVPDILGFKCFKDFFQLEGSFHGGYKKKRGLGMHGFCQRFVTG